MAAGTVIAQSITQVLQRHAEDGQNALERFVPFAYDHLRRIARALMRSERSGHTLQPTALVHEAFLKMYSGPEVNASSRAHFFGIAARVMRQILVDHARSRSSAKRGAVKESLTLNEAIAHCSEPAPAMIALDLALDALAKLDERKARIVEMRYFGGLTGEEIAAAMGLGTATVTRDLRTAEAWLARELGQSHFSTRR